MTEREYLAALYSHINFGPARTKLLIAYFGSAAHAWNAGEKKLLDVGLTFNQVEDFINYRKDLDLGKYFRNLKSQKIDFITINDSSYPENLADLDDAPLVLYVRGKMVPGDTNSVAIVGSRKMTSYGREVAEKFARELVGYGVTIVSGLAFGIDIAAHKSALAQGGRCIAVLASGPDEITPRANAWLGLEIIKKGGAIVSEFPPGTIPQRSFFPHRNRIISGLSKAVVVVEGMKKSGTLHTASHAAAQGREVFAVPGQITSPMSEAPLYLLKNGAKMATDTKDVLEELNLQLKVDREAIEKVMPAGKGEQILVDTLSSEPLHLDEIVRISGLNVSEISARLTIMELKGLVKNLGGGVYKRSLPLRGKKV